MENGRKAGNVRREERWKPWNTTTLKTMNDEFMRINAQQAFLSLPGAETQKMKQGRGQQKAIV